VNYESLLSRGTGTRRPIVRPPEFPVPTCQTSSGWGSFIWLGMLAWQLRILGNAPPENQHASRRISCNTPDDAVIGVAFARGHRLNTSVPRIRRDSDRPPMASCYRLIDTWERQVVGATVSPSVDSVDTLPSSAQLGLDDGIAIGASRRLVSCLGWEPACSSGSVLEGANRE
jgi:hypothetical protein